MLDAIILEPPSTAKRCVIWLHGLGADGHDFEPIVSQLGLPDDHEIRFVFPHAPYRAITLNGHMKMRGWYDIKTLDNLDEEDSEGIEESCSAVIELIEKQNLPSNQIILAGFSQGGAIALSVATNYPESFAGVLALSTYLPFLKSKEKTAETKQNALNVLQCHGQFDDIIPLRLGKATFDYLKSLSPRVSWKEYPMAHQVCPHEIRDISQWIQAC